MLYQQGGIPPRQVTPSLIVSTEIGVMRIYAVITALFDIYPVRVVPIGSSKFKIVLTEDDLKRITETESTTKLIKEGIKPHITSDLVFNKTLLIRGVEDFECSETDESIKATIEMKNKVKVTKVIRNPNTNKIIKLQFESTDDNDRIKNNGLLLKYTKVTTYNITQEIQTQRPVICTKCYAINDHPAYRCTKEIPVCSKCSEEGHRFTECRAEKLKCINCQGEHCAMVLSCPSIKKVIKEKNNQLYNANNNRTHFNSNSNIVRPNMSYANIIGGANTNNTIIGDGTNNLMTASPQENFAQIQSLQYLQVAKELVKEPRSNLREYVRVANRMLGHNNLPQLNIPDDILKEFSPNFTVLTHKQRMVTPVRSVSDGQVFSAPTIIPSRSLENMETDEVSLKRSRDASQSPNLINKPKKKPTCDLEEVISGVATSSKKSTSNNDDITNNELNDNTNVVKPILSPSKNQNIAKKSKKSESNKITLYFEDPRLETQKFNITEILRLLDNKHLICIDYTYFQLNSKIKREKLTSEDFEIKRKVFSQKEFAKHQSDESNNKNNSNTTDNSLQCF